MRTLVRMILFFVMAALVMGTPTESLHEEHQTAPLPQEKALKKVATPIDFPAPVGEDMKGIIIPQYDVDGRLVMNLMAEKARKINDLEVEITALKIGFFEKDGKDITVLVPHGIFNLETKILSADSSVTIKREDFEMVGASATFDTTKRFGTMKGHVHTEIRNGLPAEEL